MPKMVVKFYEMDPCSLVEPLDIENGKQALITLHGMAENRLTRVFFLPM